MEGQNPRLTYSLSYKGIIVNSANSYHPEKIDIMVSKSIDFIEGEASKDTKKRLDAMSAAEEMLMKHVDTNVAGRLKAIKDKLKNN